MDIFLLVLAGHLLGDFVAQTDWQALNKEHNWRANLFHVSSYHLVMAALILPAWHSPMAFAFLALSYASHAFIDRRWPTRMVLQLTWSKGFAETFWGVIATDQALHISLLAIAVYYMR